MEIFLLLVVLGILVLLFRNLSDVKNQLTRLDNELHEFKNLMRSGSLPAKEKLAEKPVATSGNIPAIPSVRAYEVPEMAELPVSGKEQPVLFADTKCCR